MNYSGRNNHNSLVNARPGGLSDEESNSDDDNLVFSNDISKNKGTSRNGPTFVNRHSPMGDEDWEPSGSAGTRGQSATANNNEARSPAEAVRVACMRGNLQKLKELLFGEYTTGVNQFFMGSEENPLIIAAANGHAEIMEYLLTEKKANPDLRHPTPKTTALMALIGCNIEDESAVVRGVTALVAASVNLNLQDRYGMSALMIAIKRRRSLTAKYLLENGADPNLTEPTEGLTALMIAATDGDGRLCRLLLEHDADAHLVTRSGSTAAELAQDKNHNELANLLYLVKDTKWKPGLNPNLMDQIDEERAEKKKYPCDSYAMMEESNIELLLSGVEGAKFLKNFRQHKISYVQFLHLDEGQLKEIGVDEVGVRNRILEKIKEIQNARWQDSSIRMIAVNKTVTAAEAICMMVNTNEHLQYISSSLKYLHNRISQKPLSLRYDNERYKIVDLMKHCENMEANCCKVRDDAVELHKLLGGLEGYTELQISGKIPKRTFEEFRKESEGYTVRNVIVGLLGVTVGVGLGIIIYGNAKDYWFLKN